MRNGCCIAAGMGFWVAVGISGAAVAQCSDKLELDKNQYWLLKPVPDDQMRNFSTGLAHVDNLLTPNPTFKAGVTNNVDLV
jgi:hypothetical protein